MFNNSYRKKVINISLWQLLYSGIDFCQKSLTCIEKKINAKFVFTEPEFS